jgi:membrane-associated phospholipid phosphatase
LTLVRNILIVIILGLPMISSAQERDTTFAHHEVKLNKAYVKSYFTDSWNILKAPIRWRKKQWITASAVTGVSILAYAFDNEIRDAFQRNRTDGLDQATKYFFEPLGSGFLTLSLSGGFYVYGLIAKDQRAVRTGLTAVKAIVITTVFTYAIKYATQRHRPYQDIPPDPRIWEGPFGNYNSTSFPSGHSSAIFAMAAVIASEYKDKIWVPILCYSLASLATASRVYDDEHWSSDVIFGSALGFFIGKFVYKSTVNNPNLVIIPGVSATGHPGFTMVYQLR